MKTYSYKLKFLILFLALLLFWYLGRFIPLDAAALEDTLKKFPLIYSGLIFVVLYCVITFFLFFANDIFRFVSAVIFGALISTIFVFIAELINAFILFYLARFLGRDFVKVSLKDRYEKLDERLARTNFFWLFMFRAVPLIPFRFLDLGAGLTGISFKRYLTVVIIGSPLRIFWLQYFLAGVGKGIFGNPYLMVDYLARDKFLFVFTFIYLILIFVVAFKLKKRG